MFAISAGGRLIMVTRLEPSDCGAIQKGCHAEHRRSMVDRPLRSTLRRSSGWQPAFCHYFSLCLFICSLSPPLGLL